MNKKQYYIYLTTNKINGKQYIGQHYGTPNDNYFGSGSAIKDAIAKYGKSNFSKTILCYCSKEDVDEKEKYYINLYNAVEDKNFYNCSEGGQNGDGWRAWQKYAKEHPDEVQELYQANYQRLQEWIRTHPEEARKNTEIMLSASHQFWQDHPDKLAKHMEEVQKGKYKWQQEHPEEYQEQVKRWREAGSIANSKKVICITTGEIFNSISEAGRYYKVPQPNISKCLRGERKSAGKHPQTGEKLFWSFQNKY